jgi:hypothetical protein
MEQIEINVQKNIEEVEINVQPNVTQVIINEVVGAGVETVSGNLVDNTDPNNPIVNGIQTIVAGTNVSVDDTDPANPVISATGGGAETFLELIDTPSTYTGQSGKYPKVNEAETGLEFGDAPAPDLQAVLEQGASFSLSEGTATTTGQLGNYNALQNSFRDGSVITSVDGNVTRTTIRSGSKAGCIIVNEVYDDSTEITKQGQMGILESNVIIESNYQDLNNPDDSQTASANITDGEIVISQSKKGGNNNASFRLNPGDNLNPEYTTADDEDGEQTIATREWVQSNAPGGAVDSVNGQTGDVVLDAEDVGAEPALGFTPENVANKTTDINGAAGTYPDTPTVKEYVDTQIDSLIKQIDGSVGSVVNIGNTETLVYSLFIPANTLRENVLNQIEFPFEKITAAATALQLRMYASDNEFTLGNLFAFYSNSATTRLAFTFERIFRITGGNLDPYRFSNVSRLSNKGDTVAGIALLVPFNVTQNNWIHLTALHSSVSGDVQCIQGCLNYK